MIGGGNSALEEALFLAQFAKKLEAVVGRHTVTGAEQRWQPAAVFVFVGLNPNTDFLPDGVHRDHRGFVTTDANFRTSMPGVFAAGDVRAGATKQLGAAVGEGIAALLQIRAQLQEQRLTVSVDEDPAEAIV